MSTEFSDVVFLYYLFSAETAELDLDGQGGRMFLRVLLNLVMHNYPALVSGSLQLLFRHFSQRQEVLQAFKQVTLITSQHIVHCCLYYVDVPYSLLLEESTNISPHFINISVENTIIITIIILLC